MNNLLERRITGRKIGKIIGFKDVGQFKSLIIKREDKPIITSIRLSRREVEKLRSGEKVAGIRLINKRTAGRIGTDDKMPSFGQLTPTNMVMSEPVPTYPPALAAEDVIRVMRYMKGSMDANSAYEFVIQHIPYVTPHYEEEVKAELKRMGIFIK